MRAHPFGTSGALLTSARRRLGSMVMDEDLELGLTHDEHRERASDALRAAYDDLDGDVLSLDDLD